MKKYYILLFSIFCLGIGISDAQLTTLLNFNGTNGHAPYGSLTLVGNKLYGMADSGGSYNIGCIFSIDTNGNDYKDILDFSGVNGQWPWGSLTFSNGLLYGMTSEGGVFGEGNLFSIDTDGSKYDNLFDVNYTYGSFPTGDLLISGSKVFGMIQYGGTYYYGVLFSMDTSGYNYKILVVFNDTNGKYPWRSSLQMIGNRLYGVTEQGGKYNAGVIFSIDTSGRGYRILSDTVLYPTGKLVLSGNKFYGVEEYNNLKGAIFSIDTNGREFKTLFTFNGVDGAYPEGALTLSGNKLYGMTVEGGSKSSYGYGVVFSLDTNGKGFRDLFRFDGADGGYPGGSVTVSGNKLYGMTSYGGANNMGVIFSIDTSAISTSIDKLMPTTGTITIFPNPNNAQFTVACSNTIIMGSVPTIEIYNLLGEKIYSANLVGNNTAINIKNITSGVYLYRILTSDGNIINRGKLVIDR